MQKVICTGILLAVMLLLGCGTLSKKNAADEEMQKVKVTDDKVIVYVYRLFNYSGGGRTHQLLLDQKNIGDLYRSNYYRFELWPGHYYINIFLPPENILGHSSPAMSSGQSLNFNPRDAGNTFLLIYEDGGQFRLDEAKADAMARLQKERTLARSLSARETARVKFFLSTRYDGPEMYGKPHGMGTLSWEDGGRYVGVFDHGQLTPEGRFYFPNGQIYMGELFWGRPKGWGALMAPDSRVLYAGAFLDEQPHGEGLRMGEEGPEYCRYDQGVDISKSVFQLADEIVAEEEQAELALFSENCRKAQEAVEGEAPAAEEEVMGQGEIDHDQLVEQIKASHELRLSATVRRLSKENRTKIDHERAWCRKELDQGRDWCICAPFELYAPPLKSCMR